MKAGGHLIATIMLISISLIIGCDSNMSGPETAEELAENCSIAFNSPSNSFIRFINTLDKHIDVFLPDFAIGGIVNKKSCDLYGVLAGRSLTVIIQRCSSGDFDQSGFPVECGNSGPERTLNVAVQGGETHTITIDTKFF